MNRTAVVASAVALVVALVAAGGLVVAGTSLTADGAVVALGPGEHAHVPDFGDRGALILRYDHDEDAAYGFFLRNTGRLAVTVTGIEADAREEHQMLQPAEIRLAPSGATQPAFDATAPFAPFTLRPGVARLVVVSGHFAACEYYTERAVEIHDARTVTYRVLGWTRTEQITYPDQVVVRSPTIQNCPGREMDRASHQRRGSDGG